MAGLQVYFCGSIRGGREDRALYARIVSKLRLYGRVLTEHVASEGLTEKGSSAGLKFGRTLREKDGGATEDGPKHEHGKTKPAPKAPSAGGVSCSFGGEDTLQAGDRFIHDRDVQWLKQADVVVAEVTQPSLGVGYELGRAVAMNKKILCLFRPSSGRCLSAMVRGAQNQELFFVKDYEEVDVERILDQYFKANFPDAVTTET